MEYFCTDREWLALERLERRRTAAFRILSVLTPILFVTLCLLIRTGNARVMHAVLLAVTGALGGSAGSPPGGTDGGSDPHGQDSSFQLYDVRR